MSYFRWCLTVRRLRFIRWKIAFRSLFRCQKCIYHSTAPNNMTCWYKVILSQLQYTMTTIIRKQLPVPSRDLWQKTTGTLHKHDEEPGSAGNENSQLVNKTPTNRHSDGGVHPRPVWACPKKKRAGRTSRRCVSRERMCIQSMCLATACGCTPGKKWVSESR